MYAKVFQSHPAILIRIQIFGNCVLITNAYVSVLLIGQLFVTHIFIGLLFFFQHHILIFGKPNDLLAYISLSFIKHLQVYILGDQAAYESWKLWKSW